MQNYVDGSNKLRSTGQQRKKKHILKKEKKVPATHQVYNTLWIARKACHFAFPISNNKAVDVSTLIQKKGN